ncbi:MAG: PEGA domain-containing protein [Archangiaceae bacterium]|nr:PEGA domain-containing protein [Archangiaceae bacterium]
MRRPGLCSKALIAALVAGLSSAPVAARPLVLPEQIATASSGPRLVLVVVPLDGPSKATQGVLELVGEEAARSSGKFEVVSSVDAFDPKAAAERLTKLETARTKMIDGQKALDDLDTAKGATDFGEALRLLKETDTSRSFDDLVKAWVMKAASHAMGGEVPPAKQEIERIIAVQPKAEFNSQFFPPDLLKFVEQQRKLANAAKGELSLRTEPPGANVWVNGKLVGRSPLSVKGLLGSRHQVVAALGGTGLTLAELPPGDATLELKPAELQPALVKAIDAVTKSPKTAARDQALVALGKKLQVDQVLAVLVKKSTAGEQFELTALRIEVRDGHNAGYATSTQPLAEPTDALKTFFEPLLATDAPRQGKTPVTHFDGDAGGGGGSGKKIVGIALLGVAAGLVAAGIGTGVVGQQRYEQFRATPQVQSGISQGYANEARALGGVSLGSFIGAGVAAGVGTFLLVSSGKSSADADPEPEAKKPATKKKTELRRDDGKKPEPKKEEPKKEEPKKEEPKKEEPEPAPAKVDPKEEKRRKDEEAKKAREEEARLKKEEEQRAKDEAEAKKKADAEEKKAKEEEARRAEEEKKKAEAEAKKGKKVDAKKKAEEDAAAAKAAEEEKKKKEEEERKKKEDEEKKRREEEEKKKAEQKKKEEDHDDLRNY